MQHGDFVRGKFGGRTVSWALLQGEAGTDHPEARCDSRFACKHAACTGESDCCFNRADSGGQGGHGQRAGYYLMSFSFFFFFFLVGLLSHVFSFFFFFLFSFLLLLLL